MKAICWSGIVRLLREKSSLDDNVKSKYIYAGFVFVSQPRNEIDPTTENEELKSVKETKREGKKRKEKGRRASVELIRAREVFSRNFRDGMRSNGGRITNECSSRFDKSLKPPFPIQVTDTRNMNLIRFSSLS